MAPAAGRTLLSGASAPSETSLEANVLRCLANCIERKACLKEGGVEMDSPAQNAEARTGCDSQARLPDGRCAPPQFKRPLPSGGTPSFKVPSRRVSALLKTCPASSFLVLPAVGANG